MTDGEAWSAGVPDAMKMLPMPLTGHCAVSIGERFVLVFGGGTNQKDAAGKFIPNSEPKPSNHIHLEDFEDEKWHSTSENDKQLNQINVPRVNHACIQYKEMGKIKIIIAGGVAKGPESAYEITKSAEL